MCNKKKIILLTQRERKREMVSVSRDGKKITLEKASERKMVDERVIEA